ncbi:MAG: hypothetical protein Q7T55_13035 [Solirubrobacteraceae bacterium]|nr:hypothetical protein [Solirubrobacteraceae bacterium]
MVGQTPGELDPSGRVSDAAARRAARSDSGFGRDDRPLPPSLYQVGPRTTKRAQGARFGFDWRQNVRARISGARTDLTKVAV